jgi:YVTN family beta-propeller protein
MLSSVVRNDPARVYVPNSQSNTVDVISQRTGKVIRHFAVGALPQHVTPSWDLQTLWVTNDKGNSLTPIDPRTSRPAKSVPVTDPYNLYFTVDGRYASSSRRRTSGWTSATPTRCACTARSSSAVPGRRPHGLQRRRPAGPGVVRVRGSRGRHRHRARAPAQGDLPAPGRDAPGRQALTRRPHLLRRRHGLERRLAHRRPPPAPRTPAQDRHRAPTGSTRAATRRSSTSPTAARAASP